MDLRPPPPLQRPAAVSPTADPIRAEIAIAQMRRDRARLDAAQQEIMALRSGAAARRGPSRARRVARGLFLRLPPPLRAAILGLRARPQAAPPAAPHDPVPVRGRALVIDDHWPQPDRDAGSIEIVNLVEALRALGFEVALAAGLEHGTASPARAALEAAGIRCVTDADAPSLEAYLAREGSGLDLCVLCRVYCGGRFLEEVLRSARKARIVFHSIDLHYLRLERQARLEGGAEAADVARQVRAREEAVMRACDATVVVSDAELRELESAMPDVLAVQLPLARPVVPPATPFAARAGIGFIGSFAHAPNLDAVRHFLAEIWPLVRRDLPELEFTIVGADCPTDLLDGVEGRVRVLGHVPDVGPWFEGLRLTVAPLRFGAGAKGKVASSLAAGVPCVASPVAAEGMALSEACGVLVADDPAAFAAHVVRAHEDPALWAALSRGGVAYARDTLSLPAWRGRLDAMLRLIGL
jgi:glycosyltransferase involved in cell wall biosynthesis